MIIKKLTGNIVPFATGLVAYAGNYVMGFLTDARAVLAFFAGEGVAHFVTQPVVFSALCALIVALLQCGTKFAMWFMSNDYRQRAMQAESKLQDAIRQGLIA